MVGTQVGQYAIVRELGGGSMGTVYEAKHLQLGGRAAIKVLKPELASSPETLTRFFNEAKAVNHIDHPGLVRIFDFGSLPNGSPYLVMELLSGETLAARLQARSRLSEPEALAIIGQLASILEAAHQRGIVHRDVKPSNIMLVPDPAAARGERVKLLDFGVAKITSGSLAGAVAATQAGLPIGTPLYMAPEQCEGLPSIDGKADIYALGVILFELLAGRPPFEAETPLALLNMHVRREPPPLRRLNPGVSEGTSRLVGTMLSKDKASRPSAAQLKDACGPAHAAPADAPQRALPTRQGRRVAGVALAGVLLLVGWLSYRALSPVGTPPGAMRSLPRPEPRPDLSRPADSGLPTPVPVSDGRKPIPELPLSKPNLALPAARDSDHTKNGIPNAKQPSSGKPPPPGGQRTPPPAGPTPSSPKPTGNKKRGFVPP